jgi:hypothetical protein
MPPCGDYTLAASILALGTDEVQVTCKYALRLRDYSPSALHDIINKKVRPFWGGL